MTIGGDTINGLGARSASELVLKLRKSLYGLKQAGRLWSQLLHTHLVEAGFTQCISDMCLYWSRNDGEFVVMGVFVDDLLATGTNAGDVERLFC